MYTQASPTQGEESTQTEGQHLAASSSRPAAPMMSNPATNYRENAGIILGLSRYGHPCGPVYLPTDHEHFDSSRQPWSAYSPTWDQFKALWDNLRSQGGNMQGHTSEPMEGDEERLIVTYSPDRVGDEPKKPTQQCPFVKFALVDSPINLVTNFVANFDQPDLNLQAIDQPVQNILSNVVCAPTLTADVAKHLEGNGHGIEPLAFMPFRAKPTPFEFENKTMIIQLGFPRRPRGLWLLQETDLNQQGMDENYRKGHILMDSLLLYVEEANGIPTILSFACSSDVAESMKMSFGNNYWRPRFQDPEARDLLRRLPLPFLWYAVRRWDEVSEAVDTFIGSFETVFETKTAKRLHVLRAHILHSEGLLERFKLIINGVQSGTQDEIVKKECKKLLLECNRLELQRRMHEERAKHIIDIMYNHSAERAAEASDALWSRLTMLFLPASVMAGVFGINSTLFDARTSLIIYLILTISLTVVIIWLFVAMQVENYFKGFPPGAWRRALWPYYIFGPGVRAVDALSLV
ncbi:hypothetical protein EYR38_003652 [Pleurotus pulmonarius]|nr:hypothetical protein EYR38_003652 [Pleurotus pulmonarius]